MIYEMLNLNSGGGIIPPHSKSKQFNGAALAIGLGGTGVAALARLKAKVYQQLIEDDPTTAQKTYKHIQFLGIDSDDSYVNKCKGEGTLKEREDYFSIHDEDLAALLGAKKGVIKDDGCMDWMDIDHIDRLLSPNGAGGIRQVGRFLFMRKYSEIYDVVTRKIKTARANLNTPSVDVYIFAGISGGTGSGTFIDMCYLVRDVLNREGINAATILGLFFLPDVVLSNPQMTDPLTISYNKSNGFAALKELDYLMCLKEADDWFIQNYDGNHQIRTQEKPVDMCHLISGRKADNTAFTNGFDYAVNVAADYVVSFLSDVDTGSIQIGTANDYMTMRGMVSNINHAIGGIHPNYGANLNYEVIGASNYEIPRSQIASFLAADFYSRFTKKVGRRATIVTADDIGKFARNCLLDLQSVNDRITASSDIISLPDEDYSVLQNYGTMDGNTLPPCWAVGRDAWITRLKGERKKKEESFNRELDSYAIKKFNNVAGENQSALERVFRKLFEFSVDSNYGPYYAAALLKNGSYDIDSFLQGEITTANGAAEDLRRDLILIKNSYVQSSTAFCGKKTKKNYQKYKADATLLCRQLNEINLTEELVLTLSTLKTNLGELYTKFFKPMIEMLDNLGETCEENMLFLNGEKASEKAEYTQRVVEFRDIREHLERLAAEKTEKSYVTDFIQKVYEKHEEWTKREEIRTCKFLQEYMTSEFETEAERSLDQYLLQKFQVDIKDLPTTLKDKVLPKISESARPLFWRDPSFKIDGGQTQNFATLSVPRSSTSICTAADEFAKNKDKFGVRKTGLNDRIFALRLCCGVPLHAYQGLTQLKAEYDASASTQGGVGIHLYSATPRGCNLDWRSFLPSPIPYNKDKSLVPEGKVREKLYRDAVKCGIIRPNDAATAKAADEHDAGFKDGQEKNEGQREQQGNYYYDILKTPDLAEQSQEYSEENFLTADGQLNQRDLNRERDRWITLADCLHQPVKLNENLKQWKKEGRISQFFGDREDYNLERKMLLNNGADTRSDQKEACRIDYFVHYPRLCSTVREELSKRSQLQSRIEALNEIEKKYASYTNKLQEFFDLIFFGKLMCLDGAGKPVSRKTDLIDKIVYRYTSNTEPMTLELNVSDSKGRKEYALYCAYEHYSMLCDDNMAPIPELRKWCKQYDAQSRIASDAVIPALLDETWNSEALPELRDRIKHLDETTQKNMMRFYIELVAAIRELHRRIPDYWNDAKRQLNGGALPRQGTEAVAQTAQTTRIPACGFWYVYDQGQYLYIYDPKYTGYGWNGNTYVPLSANALVLNQATNEWNLLRDPTGAVHLP